MRSKGQPLVPSLHSTFRLAWEIEVFPSRPGELGHSGQAAEAKLSFLYASVWLQSKLSAQSSGSLTSVDLKASQWVGGCISIFFLAAGAL